MIVGSGDIICWPVMLYRLMMVVIVMHMAVVVVERAVSMPPGLITHCRCQSVLGGVRRAQREQRGHEPSQD